MLMSLHPVSKICWTLYTPHPYHNLPQLQSPPIHIYGPMITQYRPKCLYLPLGLPTISKKLMKRAYGAK